MRKAWYEGECGRVGRDEGETAAASCEAHGCVVLGGGRGRAGAAAAFLRGGMSSRGRCWSKAARSEQRVATRLDESSKSRGHQGFLALSEQLKRCAEERAEHPSLCYECESTVKKGPGRLASRQLDGLAV